MHEAKPDKVERGNRQKLHWNCNTCLSLMDRRNRKKFTKNTEKHYSKLTEHY